VKTFTVNGWHGTYTVLEEQISKGGVGSIHRTTDPRWVYKQYFELTKAPSGQQLRQLTDIGRGVLIRDGLAPGHTPESSVNWPLDACSDTRGQVQGVILPAIPQTLFNEFYKPRTLDFLVLARGNPPRAKGRIALLLRMAEIMDFVNSRGLVHGDINGKNLAWCLSPAPVMYLIDCDGMVPQQPPPAVGVEAVGWRDPRLLDQVISAHDKYSDWYALALAMYRGLLLTPGNIGERRPDGSWPKPQAIPDDLDPAIADLLTRALADPLNAEARPRPRDWVQGLVSAFLRDGAFDEEAVRRLDQQSTQTSHTKPAFTPLPQTDWSSVLRGAQGHAHTRGNPGQPVGLRPRTGGPYASRQPTYPVSQQPTSYLGTGHRAAAPSYPVGRTRNIGRLAERAIDRGGWWHVRGLLSCLIIPIIAVIYIAVALFQLRELSGYMSAARTARSVLYGYGALAVASFISFVIAPNIHS
jgi:hypothetical protein